MSELFKLPAEWGSWKIKKMIGEGSFAKVYLASREEYGKTYYSAIKHISIPKNPGDADEAYLEGFAVDENSINGYYDGLMRDMLNEINTNYELKGNTNIVCYEDHLVKKNENGYGYQIYIRMEYLKSLSELIREKGGLPETEIIKLGIDMCSALEVLEPKNIIHRDIKPANIFVNEAGAYKLGDFGIAKTLDKTMGGVSIKGTVLYMAPEIMKGISVNKTSDIYSLGLVLYRLLNNNRPPFTPQNGLPITHDENSSASGRRLAGEPLPYPANCSSRTLAEIVLRACEYRPEDRWQNPRAMKKALINVLENEYGQPANDGKGDATLPIFNYGNEKNAQAEGYMDQYQNPQGYYGRKIEGNGYNDPSGVTPKITGGSFPGPGNKKRKMGIIIGSSSALLVLIVAAVVLFLYPGVLRGNGYMGRPDLTDSEIQITEGNDEKGMTEEADSSGDSQDKTDGADNGGTNKDTTETTGYVPSVVYDEESDAKVTLLESGFKYKIDYSYDDYVESGCVISQYPEAGERAVLGETISIVVSLGPEYKPSPEYYSQKVEVVTSGSYATMTLYQWNGREWEGLFSTSNVRVGANGAGYNYGEGKNVTPKGTFNLGFCYGVNRPDTGLRFKTVTPNMVFVDDPNSAYYNMLVDKNALAPGTSYESTYDQFTSRNYYSTCIFIEHNGDGETVGTSTPYMGSVITICGVKTTLKETLGCIDISSGDMSLLLSYLDESKNPVIIIS